MYYSVDSIRKIIFGWSAKCACSHIKNIYWFLQTNNLENSIHSKKDCNKLPDDIENYVHRIGRTGRAGASGSSISFACEEYAINLPAFKDIGMLEFDPLSTSLFGYNDSGKE